ncbi:MAG: glycosyltransferase family 2 protein [Candidatus Marinimicrobia bacterium]|nr:glycosyltransferase family 2 protein [Candidatus Neomarinimicrobiota bacterium]
MLYSIVIPVYNEQENLPTLLTEVTAVMQKVNEPYEVILIDDGSTDGSFHIMTSSASMDPHIHPFRLSQNSGQSAALAAGFQLAKGKYVITMDSDLQNDPADIGKMTPFLQTYDMVTGWRQKRNDTWLKRVSSRFANTVRNTLSRENITDTGCSLKIMDRQYLSKIKMFKGMHRFLPTLMKMEGASVIEIPVNHRSRVAGDSKYGTWDRAFSGLRDLLVVRWMQDRFIKISLKDRIEDK